jgi:hypothetical protein
MYGRFRLEMNTRLDLAAALRQMDTAKRLETTYSSTR